MSDDFTKQLQSACRAEGLEHVLLLQNSLVKIESASATEQPLLIEQSFRSLHNIKGSAHAAEFYTVESLCHPMEDIMAAAKAGTTKMSPQLIDLLLEGVGVVSSLLKDEDETAHLPAVQAVLAQLAELLGHSPSLPENDETHEGPAYRDHPLPEEPGEAKVGQAVVAPTVTRDPGGTLQETLRISAEKVDLLMQQAEELLTLKTGARAHANLAQELRRKMDGYTKSWSKSMPDMKDVRRLIDLMLAAATSPQDQLPWRTMRNIMDDFGEMLTAVAGDTKELSRSLTDYSYTTANAVEALLDDTKGLLMISCSSLFAGFPLAVRQLARQLGKEVSLTITGGDIELDRRILGQLKDPLIHILRNSLDHGIESPVERAKYGKPAKGLLRISAAQVERQVELRITDDGSGIDSARLKATAIKQGLLTREEAGRLPAHEALRLIFKSALSTSTVVSEISGRGLGLAIVEEQIQQLGGSIEVETEAHKGTTFIIRLPLTIATFRGVLVQVGGKVLVVPTANIDRVVRISEQSIKAVDGTDTCLLDDVLVPICTIEDLLRVPRTFRPPAEDKHVLVCVVRIASERMGLIVDEVIGEQEVLVKNLGPIFAGVTAVLGVTVLGTGRVVPILNINEMLKVYRQRRAGSVRASADVTITDGAEQKEPRLALHTANGTKVLVVDDMVTARMLMRNIFESAGFTVRTANNGLEALAALQEEKFDIVVTDIEMPVMDGFRLTEEIRSDPRLSGLPVVIVTSLASRADKERGVAAGCNAYFSKSSFDQDNLLDVVNNLV